VCPLTDASKDLKTILLSLLEMVGSKKVSGHGRDQALNLLTKNVPRKVKKDIDHTKSLFTIDHGKRWNNACVGHIAFIFTSSILGKYHHHSV